MKITFKSIVFGLLAFAISHGSTAQTKSDTKLQRISMPKFTPTEEEGVRYIPMDFNKAIPKEKLRGIDPKMIISVTLVYTNYKKAESFDQLQLNEARTRKLYQQIPSLKNNKRVRWYWIGQTDCNSPEECTGFFHGFVIKYYTKKSIDKLALEDAMMDYYVEKYTKGRLSSKVLDSLMKLEGSSIIYQCDTNRWTTAITGTKLGKVRHLRESSKAKLIKKLNKAFEAEEESFTFYLDKKRKITGMENVEEKKIAVLKKTLEKFYRFGSTKYQHKRCNASVNVLFSRNEKGKIIDISYVLIPLDEEKKPIMNFEMKYMDHEEINCQYIDTGRLKTSAGTILSEEVVLDVMERVPSFDRCLIATDVTGSMYPYLGQFLAWHKLNLANTNKAYDFVFFNDGDDILDQLKVTGKVGGLYHIRTDSYDSVKKTLMYAKAMGNGGDGPENNVEAILYGLKQNPRIKSVILIADNWATPRDLSLLRKVKVPIRVILCGSKSGINTDYLNMVRSNGGSIHTIEDDLTNLSKLREGERITIEGFTYELKEGKFTQVKEDKTKKS